MPTLKQQCPSCSGTGLYSGMCEAKGEAVVCVTCGGLGWNLHRYRAFTGRKRRRGIKSIRVSRGALLSGGVGGIGKAMTYAEFEKRF